MKNIKDSINNNRLRDFCERLSPEKRVKVVILLFALQAMIALYLLLRVVYNISVN